jgi:hypothetical protein
MKRPKKYNVDSKIRSALRRIWLYSPQRREALAGAKLRGMPLYACAKCKKHFIKQQVHVDHIEACGPSCIGNYDDFITKLFHGKLQVLCVLCHKVKSGVDLKTML